MSAAISTLPRLGNVECGIDHDTTVGVIYSLPIFYAWCRSLTSFFVPIGHSQTH